MSKNKLIVKGLGTLTAVIITTGIVMVGCGGDKDKKAQEDIKGRQLLVELESQSVSSIEEKLEEHFATFKMENGDEEGQAVNDDIEKAPDENTNTNSNTASGNGSTEDDEDIYSKDYNTIFEDTIFMGDSITEGLFYMEVIDESKVLAAMGETIVKAKDDVSKVVSLNPKKIVLLFGMNDVILFQEVSEWTSIDSFKANYKELLETLKGRLPYAEIYVQSPLSVAEGKLSASDRLTNENLDRFRVAVEEVCEETEVNYVDINTILEGNNDLRAEDGIHLKHDFYVEWMNYLDKYIKN